jgi:hypothetical protein
MKLCINCKFYQQVGVEKEKTHLSKCTALSVTSPVDGKPTPTDQLEWCSVMRMPSNKDCGLSAILYSEKESNHV